MSQSRVAPNVITGARGPEAAALREEAAKAAGRRRAINVRPGEVEYHSTAGNYFVQLTDPLPKTDPVTGIQERVRALHFKFRNGRAVTGNEQVIHRVEGCQPGCPLHPKGLPTHPNFGLGRDFWRADEAEEKAQAAALEAAAQTIRNLTHERPELVNKILTELGPEFDVVPTTPKAPSKDSALGRRP